MKILLTLPFFLPMTAHASLLDLLPLKMIERKMIYPLSADYNTPAQVGLPNTREYKMERARLNNCLERSSQRQSTRNTPLFTWQWRKFSDARAAVSNVASSRL